MLFTGGKHKIHRKYHLLLFQEVWRLQYRTWQYIAFFRAYLINILKALVLGRYFDKKKQDVNWFGGGNCEPSEKCFDKFKSALNETEKGHTSRDFDDHIVVICKVNKNIKFLANI